MNTPFFNAFLRACVCAATVFAAVGANHAAAQTPVRPEKAKAAALPRADTPPAPAPERADKIMTIAELRACMTLDQSNKKAAAEILQEQDSFRRDQDAVKAEQSEVSKADEEVRARSATIVTERDAASALVSALTAKAQAAKTDAEKAEADAERVKLVERSRLLEQNIDSFNASQQTLRDRVSALNARIDAINQRNKTTNVRVEPQQKLIAEWRDQCGGRRFREEDEIVIKKELAAAP